MVIWHSVKELLAKTVLRGHETHIDWEPGGVNLAGKVKNLFLVTVDVYRV